MTGFQKLSRAPSGVLVALLLVSAPAGFAQSRGERAAKLDVLLTELSEPGRADWETVETEIERLWSQSGSPAMDLLLRRGQEAMAAEDYAAAVEHFSALIDHAPEFAEGWNGRATAFFYMDEYSLSLADIERTLALNPKHFGALEGLAAIFEAMEQPDLAIDAAEAALAINPNRPSLQETRKRLERATGSTEL
ncbi:tetratricopeptide repeat protein [Amaricoccus sp.]|uniref:tetratricopeptide repeat protein n=1 Tax=Amaricoccus sp. TaxID=1872485 RepID=UPI0025B9F2C9|nr:tetratricopeptide repeat protein [Amaricoccus sp.]